MLRVGLEVFLEQEVPGSFGERIALLSNHACTDRNFRYAKDLLQKKLGDRLCLLFSPQHGFYAEKQDNMIESGHAVDPATGLPVYSLYGRERKPTEEMCAGFDTLLIDLIDIGTRVYTFMYTMAYCLQAAAEYGKKVVILDRPNPLGGVEVEGNILQDDYRSFVGLYNIPMRHGLTLGELALYFNGEYAIGADIEVIKVQGWSREQYMDETDFPWLAPSPNMPSLEAALHYPGQVLWEGTLVSEARGTTQPFILCGAPYWQHAAMDAYLTKYDFPGCYLRPVVFEPTSGKWMGENCVGYQIHILDRKLYKPYRLGLQLLQAAMLVYPEQFEYKQPPYEYEYHLLPLDLLIGDRHIRKALAAGVSVEELEQNWHLELLSYEQSRRKYFLYDEIAS